MARKNKAKWEQDYTLAEIGGLWRRTIVYRCPDCKLMTLVEWNYCPNCGVRRKEENDGESL